MYDFRFFDCYCIFNMFIFNFTFLFNLLKGRKDLKYDYISVFN